MNEQLAGQRDWRHWVDANTRMMIEKDLAAKDEELYVLRRRIMDLEGCLVHVRNYLPEALKLRCEEILWPKVEK